MAWSRHQACTWPILYYDLWYPDWSTSSWKIIKHNVPVDPFEIWGNIPCARCLPNPLAWNTWESWVPPGQLAVTLSMRFFASHTICHSNRYRVKIVSECPGQCWKFPQVRRSEADNFGEGLGTFCWFFFNFMFIICDSRHEDLQLFWLSFQHWSWLVGKLENVVVSCNTAHIGGLCISLRHWSMCQYIFVIVCPGNSFYMCCASNIHTFPQIQCSWEYFLHGWSSVSEVVATFKPPCLNCRSFVSSTTNGMSE